MNKNKHATTSYHVAVKALKHAGSRTIFIIHNIHNKSTFSCVDNITKCTEHCVVKACFCEYSTVTASSVCVRSCLFYEGL